MLIIGIDDTDVAGSPGTNNVVRPIALGFASRFPILGITRHQLLVDPRIPYTSKNSSAAIMLPEVAASEAPALAALIRRGLKAACPVGSDPGLCIAGHVPPEVMEFGRRAKQEVLDQPAARDLASRAGLHLEGIGGDEGGVIGALAAVGLAATGDDGRFVQLGAWPDDLSGLQPADELRRRGVALFLAEPDGAPVELVSVDIGKRLRPSYRGGRIVLYVQRTSSGWQAVRKE